MSRGGAGRRPPGEPSRGGGGRPRRTADPARRSFGTTLARSAGFAVAALGLWIIVGNVAESGYRGGTLALILGAGAAGAAGGIAYAFSFDGPPGARTPLVRRLGWFGMFVLAALPTGFSLLLFVALAAMLPTLARSRFAADENGDTAS